MTAHKPNTHRAYLLEVERLLLWSILTKQKPISSLDVGDYREYFAFLDDPQPQEQWCLPKNAQSPKRWSKDWKPFTGPLSPTSKAKAVAAINKMLKYWFEQGYIDHNPLSAINLSQYKNNSKDLRRLRVLSRAFTEHEWHLIMQALKQLPEHDLAARKNKARVRFIIMTLIYTGLRRDELARLTWNAYQVVDDMIYLVVSGKSGKPQTITLPNAYVREIKQYRVNYQLGQPWPEKNDYSHVITGRYNFKPISTTHLNNLIKALLQDASTLTNDVKIQHHLQAGSAHWFRHTAATFLDKQAVDPMVIKSHMRHSSFETTEIYIHKDAVEKKAAIERLASIIDS